MNEIKIHSPGFVRYVDIHDHGFVRYIDHMGSDLRIVEAARVSYLSPSKGDAQDKKLLRYLFKNRHTSPFEMAKITFNIRMPIYCMRQFIRHRMQNVNEQSARYTQMVDDFHVPEEWRSQDTENKQGSITSDTLSQKHATLIARSAYEKAYKHYKELVSLGVAREQARIVLPVGIYTEFYSTWDLNNLIKFFKLRIHSHAQQEIMDYATGMFIVMQSHFPWVAELIEEVLEVKPNIKK